MLPYNKRLKGLSQALRSNMTAPEKAIWQRLRKKQLLGVQFYRQKPIAGYIVDFYCATANLVIELDGSQHFEPQHQANDIERDKVLQSLGLRVLRFDNRQVLLEIDNVITAIMHALENK